METNKIAKQNKEQRKTKKLNFCNKKNLSAIL